MSGQEPSSPGLLLSEMRGITVESMTTFDSTKESLLDLLQSVKQGKTASFPTFNAGGSGTTTILGACSRAFHCRFRSARS